MADRPILFSAPMVRALLDGRKTQTRRTLNPQPHLIGTTGSYIGKDGKGHQIRIAIGDRLYVRENWRTSPEHDDTAPRDLANGAPLCFLADTGLTFPSPLWGRHRQAMHMPRWASRLTLTVTDVRVERLQDVSRGDAIAEGLIKLPATGRYVVTKGDQYFGSASFDPREVYSWLWDNINSEGAWQANPWVVAYTFSVQHGNIDQIGGA